MTGLGRERSAYQGSPGWDQQGRDAEVGVGGGGELHEPREVLKKEVGEAASSCIAVPRALILWVEMFLIGLHDIGTERWPSLQQCGSIIHVTKLSANTEKISSQCWHLGK